MLFHNDLRYIVRKRKGDGETPMRHTTNIDQQKIFGL